ncbi:glycosyltransferase family 2 protein [Desulfoluna spongiiphila]|uniref:glycosyltransferase family 2 protein n=1 Tax=Desulfoluna spongiiphila TaxID=419481 RepID=UPI0012595A08|nr:glycosyltransferase family 2 protein [Desulfoluna spongiiphila]VVS95301.1 nucleotide-diphospho-sugar transferases [Desulfoluna spongiiphila]
MINHLVSVIIPTYNREKSILRAVSSVLNQTYTNIEVIVVDDGSTDNTESIVLKIKDKRLKYFKTKNHGANFARNFGIKKSSGEIIGFNDSDDEWLPTKIEIQLGYLIKNDLDAVFTQLKIKRTRKEYIVPKNIPINLNLKNAILVCNYIGTPSLLLKKKVFEEIGLFSIELKRLQDWDFAIRLCQFQKVGFLKIPTANIYTGTDSITCNYSLLKSALDILISNNSKFIEQLPDNAKDLAYLQYARFYVRAADYSNGHKYISKAKRLSFEKTFTYIYIYIAKILYKH